VEQYKNYIKELHAQGYSADQIRQMLQKQGLDEATIDQLVTTAPPAFTAPAAAGSPTSPITPSPTPPPEAYIDYIKALMGRGESPQDIDVHLAQYGVDEHTRSAALQLTSQAAVPQNYPAPSSLQNSSNVMGQAPISAAPVITGSTPTASTKSWKGWLITALSCIIPSLVITIDSPDRFLNSTYTLLTLGDITAVIGLCLYVMDMVLATRLAAIEDWFGGLNKVYIAHAVIGSAALTTIMIHPILLAIRYAPLGMHTVAAFFIPTTKYLSSAFGIVGLALMLALLILTFYIRLPYRIWLATHKYLGVAYLLICIHVLFTPNVITDNFFIRIYLIALVAIGLAAYVYRTLLPNIFVRHYVYLVHAVSEKSAGVVEVTLTPTTKAINFQAGQFIFLSFQADGLSSEWHPFTIVSPPNPNTLDVAIKSLGGYTETMTRLLPHLVGMSVLVEGAYGRFSFRNFHNANQVWIAGGIGITPFLSMAQKLGDGPFNIDLYYSVRSEAELIDLDKLMYAQQNQPGKVFRVFPFVTEKYNRRLSADLIAATTGDLTQRDFLICGPTPMMNSMKDQLVKMGVKKYKIHSEEFSVK
jgi:predicted ferric reductase